MNNIIYKSQLWNYILIFALIAKIQNNELASSNSTVSQSLQAKETPFKEHTKPSIRKLDQHLIAKTKLNKSQHEEKSNVEIQRMIENNKSLVQRVKLRLTRSRDAKWASLSFSFICILLLFGVCYSKMWREYHSTASHQPLPLFMIRERVPFIEVIRRKVRLLKQLQKQKKNSSEELKRLIIENEKYEMENSCNTERLED